MTQADSLPRHLSASDSIAWRIEENPILRSTITMVMLLDQAPDQAKLRKKLDVASSAFPRLRQRIVGVPLRVSTPVWSVDPDFDLDFHLRFVRASGDRSYRSLLDLAASFGMQAFDRDRPLWESTVVDDLEDGGSAMIFKVHHSLTDGVGGVLLMSQLFDFGRDGGSKLPDEVEVPEGEHYDAVKLWMEGARNEVERRLSQGKDAVAQVAEAVRTPISSGHEAVGDVASAARLLAPVRGPLSPIMLDRSPRYHFDAFSVPVEELKAAAHRSGGKLNDAFMAGVVLGLRNYHEAHGVRPEQLRVNMPVNLRRSGDTAAGNHWAPARFPVPLYADNVDDLMHRVHDIVAEQRAEPALGFTEEIADVLNLLPTGILTQVFGGLLTSLDFAASNVPGVPIPIYVAGARVESMEAFAPPAGASANFCLLSYRDKATIGINSDPAAIPDPGLMLGCVRDGFDAVLKPE